MENKYFIGLDLGTSGVKGALLCTDGEVAKTVTVPFSYYTEGEAKLMSTDGFIRSCYTAIKALAEAVDGEIAAICASGASGSMTALDGKGEPIIPIIGWQTNIAAEDLAEFYTDEEKRELRQIVGWPIGRGFPGAYIPAIRKRRPDIFERAAYFVMSIEYLVYTLTGRLGISHSLATPSTLCDQRAGVYNKRLLDKLSVSEDMLPPLYDRCTSVGRVRAEVADSLHLSRECRVVLGSFDHPAGAVGAGVLDIGEGLLSLGTSWVTLFPIGERECAEGKPLLIDRFLLSGAPYLVMKSIASVTEKINRARKALLGSPSHAEFDSLAAASERGAGGLVLSFTEGDEDAVLGKERRHVARAIIECAARMLRDNLELMAELGFVTNRLVMIGGITNSAVCSRIIAETLERQITVINGEAAGAVGSAIMAAVGVGEFRDEREAFEKMNFAKTVYTPQSTPYV